MPPGDLTPSERASIRTLLEDLLADLELREAQLAESSEPVSLEQPIGRLSRMDAIQSQEMARAGLAQIRVRLERTRRALQRAEAPDFGTCEHCGGAIGFDRLEFEPETALCVRCA